MTYRLILTTCPDEACAEAIARALVEQRLAACVNIIPGSRSVYEWQGKVVMEQELLLLIKSRSDRLTMLQESLLALHPYDVPELIALPIESGSDSYLNWIDSVLDTK